MTTATTPLVSVRNLVKTYAGRRSFLGRRNPPNKALDDVSFDVRHGETLGLVGESGSGKSTAGRILLRLENASAGEVFFDGAEITRLSPRQLKPYRRDAQIIFQDPYGALNPRMTVGDFVAEPLIVHNVLPSAAERRDRVSALFLQVGLDPRFMHRYPHEFSGGQRQRVNIARAIALKPRFILADEPITALDVSIQAQIVNLFQDLQEQLGLTYLLVAHDLSMIRYLCDRLAVLMRGRIVEIGPTESIFAGSRHPYTKALLSAIPIPDPDLERQRKPLSFDYLSQKPTPDATLREVGEDHFVLS